MYKDQILTERLLGPVVEKLRKQRDEALQSFLVSKFGSLEMAERFSLIYRVEEEVVHDSFEGNTYVQQFKFKLVPR